MTDQPDLPPADPTVPENGGGGASRPKASRRSPFDGRLASPLSRAPWFAVSAGVHVLAVTLLMLFGPSPARIRPIDPSRRGVIEATQSADADGGPALPSDMVSPPDEVESPFVAPDATEPDPSDATPPLPDAPPDLPPPDSTPIPPPEIEGPDRAVIGLRVKPVRPPDAPPSPTPPPDVPLPPPAPPSPVHVAPSVDDEYASDINRKAAARLKAVIGDKTSGLGRAIRGVKSEDLIVVSNGKSHDHLEYVLDAVSIPYGQVSVAEFARETDLSRTRLVFWNCGTPVTDSAVRRLATEKVRRFVDAGGYLWGTDWALRDVIAAAFPGRLAIGNDNLHTLPELVVDVGPVANSTADPLLEGVLATGGCRWWLEEASVEVKILDASSVTVLLESPALAAIARSRSGVIAATFTAGRGRVLHVMGHAWQEKSDLEGTVSMQRLALNFVRQRVERDAR